MKLHESILKAYKHAYYCYWTSTWRSLWINYRLKQDKNKHTSYSNSHFLLVIFFLSRKEMLWLKLMHWCEKMQRLELLTIIQLHSCLGGVRLHQSISIYKNALKENLIAMKNNQEVFNHRVWAFPSRQRILIIISRYFWSKNSLKEILIAMKNIKKFSIVSLAFPPTDFNHYQ